MRWQTLWRLQGVCDGERVEGGAAEGEAANARVPARDRPPAALRGALALERAPRASRALALAARRARDERRDSGARLARTRSTASSRRRFSNACAPRSRRRGLHAESWRRAAQSRAPGRRVRLPNAARNTLPPHLLPLLLRIPLRENRVPSGNDRIDVFIHLNIT